MTWRTLVDNVFARHKNCSSSRLTVQRSAAHTQTHAHEHTQKDAHSHSNTRTRAHARALDLSQIRGPVENHMKYLTWDQKLEFLVDLSGECWLVIVVICD